MKIYHLISYKNDVLQITIDKESTTNPFQHSVSLDLPEDEAIKRYTARDHHLSQCARNSEAPWVGGLQSRQESIPEVGSAASSRHD